MHGEATIRDMLGSKSHGRPMHEGIAVGATKGGEQTRGPEHNGMTAAPKRVPH